jgi:small-conductance mechanosensitive channel
MDLAGTFQTLLVDLLKFIPRLIASLITFVLALIVSGLVARWVRRVAQARIEHVEVCLLLSRLARWTIIVLGTLVALDMVNFDVTSFVAGLGVVGLTVGFALQDIARNFVAGVLLLIRQPFKIGDAVQVGDYAGQVLNVHTRDTTIKTWDGEKVILPNIEVFGKAIVNYSDLPHRRRTVYIGLGYDENVDRAKQVLLEAVLGVDGVLDDPAPRIHAEELGDSALILAARFWLDQRTHGLFDVHSDAVQAIKEAAEEHGIDLPYPVYTVRLGAQNDGES